jgi:long-chain fatty acid transport protein
VYGLVPIKNFVTLDSFYVDEHEQYSSNSLHPELYSDRLSALSFAGGAGVRLTKTLSLGVGATINLVANAQAPVYVANASELTKLDLNVHAKAKVRLTPHAGLAWNPGKRWHFTGTLHAPQKFDLHASFTFLLGGNDQSSGLALAYWYKPWQASVGAGYDFYMRGDQVWGVSYTLQYERWSKYIDRQSVRPAGAYAWNDTINGTVGLRGQSGPLSLGLDGRYTPSPVPSQTGRTNYVDNDRVGSSLNMEYAFKIFDFDFKLGAQLQLYRLITRSVKKITPPPSPDGVNRTPQLVWDEVPDDAVRSGKPLAGREGLQTNNPGWPGYSSRGWVSSGGIYLSLYM